MKSVRKFFFGSPDRILSTISLFIGGLGLAITVYTIAYPEPVPVLIIVRDMLIIFFLVLFLCILSLKYFKKDDLAERFRNLLKNQLIGCHQLEHKFRDHFFSEIRNTLVNGNLKKECIDAASKSYFQKVCHSVFTDIRQMFTEYFLSRGFKLDDDLTVTLKTVISQQEAQHILEKTKKDKADTLTSNQEYIVTAFRDPFTFEKRPERNEIKGVVYRISEENTAFDRVLNKGENFYLSNDLKKDHDATLYHNANPKWKNNYNSTLVVPIRHLHDPASNKATRYGVLAIDSKNPLGYELFDSVIAVNMLARAADALAIMFGHLEIMELIKEGDNDNFSK